VGQVPVKGCSDRPSRKHAHDGGRGMNLLVRRRVLWDYLAGALWVLPTLSVVVFLAAGALLSRV
jgi:uncharacterized membrane protein